jgi:RNA-directed DNA polymerase
VQEGGDAMSGRDGIGPGRGPARAKQAGEARDRWSWADPLVWTERMLTALAEGVKGGKWDSLIDKVYAEPVLGAALARVAAKQGVDHVTIARVTSERDANLKRLSEELRSGTCRPPAIRRHYIPKPGSRERRPLGIPTVRDRVVPTALRAVLEPIFEQGFAAHGYGVRPHRGCKDARRRVDGRLKAGHVHIGDADLKSYFDTIPKDRRPAQLGRKVADGRILALVEAFLNQGVLDGAEGWTPEEGTPQGAVISPLLSNIDLGPLDHLMAEAGFEMVRDADDFVVLCRSPEEAAAAPAAVQRWTAEAGLTLHPSKTRRVDARSEGFDFLGSCFDAGRRWPRSKSLRKPKDTIRAKTKRTSGPSLPQIIAGVNRTLGGWFEYFKHSHRRTFRILDSWIRRRLRSRLRKRLGLRGIARIHGGDHRRWPKAFLAEHGRFSLQEAHALACQSPRG